MTYSYREFNKLKASYLEWLKEHNENVADFFLRMLSRYTPISDQIATYVRFLVDANSYGLDLVVEIAIFDHYAKIGKNIVVETIDGKHIGTRSNQAVLELIKELRRDCDAWFKERKKQKKEQNK